MAETVTELKPRNPARKTGNERDLGGRSEAGLWKKNVQVEVITNVPVRESSLLTVLGMRCA